MTTPNDPYNTANPRPFDDDDILEPIVENTERPLPEPTPEHVPGDTVETDDAPDFGDPVPFPPASTPTWDTPSETATTDVENENADYKDYNLTPIPQVTPENDLPMPAEPVIESHPNPTLGTLLGEPEPAPATLSTPVAMPANDTPFEPVSPTRTSVMDVAAEEPVFAEPREDWSTDPGELSTIPEAPKGRGWLHVGGFFLTFFLLPIAWYLISDAGARFYLVDNNPWQAKSFAFFPFLELLGGLFVIAMIWLTARATSLGAQFWGAIVTLCGLVALIVPTYAQQGIAWLDAQIGSYNAFTGNVIHHIELDFGTGRVAIYGFLLFMTGIAAHAARRRGQVYATAVTRRELLLSKDSTEPEK